LNFKLVASVFVVLTVVFGVSTGYLLAYPSGGSSASATTIITTSVGTVVTTSVQATTVTAAGSGGFSVGIAYKSGVGFYLVDGSGMTLYYRTKDIQSNGTSTCTGGCVQSWPVFYAAKLVLPPGLNASSFRVVSRSDGRQQLTYDGWPLYYFAGDQKPGDLLGQGIGGVWFAYPLPAPSQTDAPPSTTITSSSTASFATSITTSATSTATTSAASTTSTSSQATATSTSSTSSSSTTTTSVTTSSAANGYW